MTLSSTQTVLDMTNLPYISALCYVNMMEITDAKSAMRIQFAVYYRILLK